MLDFNVIEKELGEKLTEEKKQEISSLEDHSNEKIRSNKIGQKFGRLLVIGRGPIKYISGHSQGTYWCICSCPKHNITLVKNCNLKSGNTKSCGCLNIEKGTERIIKAGKKSALNLTNKIFGDLIALYPTDKRNNYSVVWICKCSCGKIVEAPAKELQRGTILSCGHNKDSKGVRKIKEVLNKANIPYVTEKVFQGVYFPKTNGMPRYDFYVNDEYLIEYDGEQHFLKRAAGFFKDSLETIQAHDKFKNEWCKSQKIPLIRFSYIELDLISLEEIERRLALNKLNL